MEIHSFYGGESENQGKNTQKDQVLAQMCVISEKKITKSV